MKTSLTPLRNTLKNCAKILVDSTSISVIKIGRSSDLFQRSDLNTKNMAGEKSRVNWAQCSDAGLPL